VVNSRYAVAATVIALIAIGVSFAWILLDRTPPSWDDAGYLSKSLELYDSLGTKGIVGYVAKFVTVMHDKPPLIAAALTPVYFIFGRRYRAAYFVNLLFLAVTFGSIYRIAKDFGTNRAGLIAVAAASPMPIVFAVSHWYLVECGLIAIVCAAIWIVTGWSESSGVARASLFGSRAR
jgi:4-amino-4-deoxy-L-arabinose transferase-like glycosyltransferase